MCTEMIRAWRRVIASVCLVGVFGSASGFVPSLAVFVGQLDSDHRVVVIASGEQVEVRFYHLEEESAVASHDGLGVIEAHAPDTHHDHVMKFASVKNSLVSLVSAVSEPALVCGALPETKQWSPILRTCSAAAHARPPPGATTFARCLGSVVLLV